MRITKDEGIIIADVIAEWKYEYAYGDKPLFHALTKLHERIENESKDLRRVGRTSQNDFCDIKKRFTEAYQDGRE